MWLLVSNIMYKSDFFSLFTLTPVPSVATQACICQVLSLSRCRPNACATSLAGSAETLEEVIL